MESKLIMNVSWVFIFFGYSILLAVVVQSADHHEELPVPDLGLHDVSGPSDNHSTHNSSDHGDHHEHELRYHVAKLDFGYVATPFTIAAVIICASLAKIGFHLNNKLSSIFPESCLLIVIGVIVGVVLFLAKVEHYEMDTTTFFLFLLPPIVLEAGYFMPARAFFDNLGTILTFAVIGTLWNTLFIGLSLWGFSFTSAVTTGRIEILHCFAFSSLISAVDPVAVIAVFEEIHVNENLHIVVFGESLMNDAVTVVLYHMFDTFSEIGINNILPIDIVLGLVSFFVVSLGGTLIGVLFGFATAFMTRFTSPVRVVEPLVIFAMGYISYLTAEIFHLSGILACMFCGMTMNKYVEKNISTKSQTTLKYFMKMMASVCETIIFMFLGISTVTKDHSWETGFVLFTLLCCLIYRALGVMIFTGILNRSRIVPISNVDQFIMAYGGLRGAIAFALVELLSIEIFPNKKLFVTTCVVVIYFTVFVQGGTIKFFVNILRVKTRTKSHPSMNEKLNNRLIDHLMTGIEDVTGYQGHNDLRESFKRINDKYIKPIIVKDKSKIKSGRSFLNVYQKLTERDAQQFLQKNGSFSLDSNLRPSDISRTNSLAHLFRRYSVTTALQENGYDNQLDKNGNENSIPMPSNVSSTVLDMRALEAPGTLSTLHRVNTEIHHLLDDNLFQPRRKYNTKYQKQMLPEVDTQAPFHHKARLHLRQLMSPKRVTHRRRKSDVFKVETMLNENGIEHNHDGKPRKNVSFADMKEVTIRVHEATPEPQKKSDESEEEDGIYFTVSEQGPDHQNEPTVSDTPTAAETTLPWRVVMPSSPLSSHRSPHHSEPNLRELDNLQLVHEPIIPNDNTALTNNPAAAPYSNGTEGYTNYAMQDNNHHHPATGDHNPAGSHNKPPSVVINKAVDPERQNVRVENERLHQTSTGGDSKHEDDSADNLPLPWKSAPSQTELSHAQDMAAPTASYQLKPLPSNMVKSDTAAIEDSLSPIPPPWKNNGHSNRSITGGPVVSQSTPYHEESNVKTEVENDEGERGIITSIPPPWRQLSNSSIDFIGSPSIACTLDSMRPHPSTHSFHISEAESHHSQHMHMHNLIDIPNNPPQNNYEHECDVSDNEEDFDLEQDQHDGDEICAHWILTCQPDLHLAVDDKEYNSDECGQVESSDTSHGGLLHSFSNCSTSDLQNDSCNKAKTEHFLGNEFHTKL